MSQDVKDSYAHLGDGSCGTRREVWKTHTLTWATGLAERAGGVEDSYAHLGDGSCGTRREVRKISSLVEKAFWIARSVLSSNGGGTIPAMELTPSPCHGGRSALPIALRQRGARPG